MVAKYFMSEAVARLSSIAGGLRYVIDLERITSDLPRQLPFLSPAYVVEVSDF